MNRRKFPYSFFVFFLCFKNMNINGYIQALPEYRKAVQDMGPENKFDFVAPIIILEGMKFYDEVLLPKLK